ncbi:hypothetical protein SO802_018145 [Lithocarpus litseifolius]|uniref:Reverse transcriptase zinc-binding domain-containing protein n=1 Tax=Lithocarpus litseifolius TaxID=425828 RepID=A0AAW2CLW8_9ROSI
MGFKDLANFNDALLAKQAWRLLHNKDSLFYRVFKMKFFPNCSIWEAQDSSSGSHAWHSIIKGRDVLLKGARWRVGCGEDISNPQQQNEVWKLIWGLNVPNKVRNFMWRACKESIPTMHNLLKRKILNEDRCEQCGVESETTAHALWNCSTSDEIWESTPGFKDRSQLGASSIMDLINLTHEKRKNVDLLAMVMWTIWHRRNQLRALATYQQSQQSLINHAAVLRPQHHAQWRPPPANCVKLNFDGAVFPELGKAGLGVVVHNCQGNAIATLSEQAPLPFSPIIVEAMAAARAITFAQELGITEFMLEGDLEAVINSLRSAEASLTTYGHLLESAKSTLVTSNCIAFSHIRRSGNRVAHNLAKHAKHVRGLSVWVENIPPNLYDVLFADPG